MDIKTPFTLKLYMFLVNLYIIIPMILLPIHIFDSVIFIRLWTLVLVNILFFFILKNKLWAVWLFFAVFSLPFIYVLFSIKNLLDLINTWNFLPNMFMFGANQELEYVFLGIQAFLLIFGILVLIKSIIYFKRIKKWPVLLDEKYLTEKEPTKWLFVSIVLSIILVFAYRFSYYDNWRFEEVEDKFFVATYADMELKDEENLFKAIYEFKWYENDEKDFRDEFFSCLYESKCYENLAYYKEILSNFEKNWNKKEFNFNKAEEKTWKELFVIKRFLKSKSNIWLKNTLETIKDFKKLKEFASKKYFIPNVKDELLKKEIYHLELIKASRFETFYLLNNSKETEAINLLASKIKYLKILANSDIFSSIIIWNKYYQEALDDIKNILNNFKISEKSKKMLAEAISDKIDEKTTFENVFKRQYNYILKEISENKNLKEDSTLYSLETTKKALKHVFYKKIENFKNNQETEFIDYKTSFLKSNIIWTDIVFYQDGIKYSDLWLSETETKRQEILKKLEN